MSIPNNPQLMQTFQGIAQQLKSQAEMGQVDTARQGAMGIVPQNLAPIGGEQGPVQMSRQLDQAKFIQALLPLMARGNTGAQTEFTNRMKMRPETFTASGTSGIYQKDYMGNVSTVRPPSPPTAKKIGTGWTLKRDAKGKPVTEKVGKTTQMIEIEVDDSGAPTGRERPKGAGTEGVGNTTAKEARLERLYNEFTSIDANLKDLAVGLYRGRPMKELPFFANMDDKQIARWVEQEKKRLTGDLTGKSNSIKRLEGELGLGGAQETPEAPKNSGTIRVRRKSDGQTGTIDASDFDPNKYERVK